MAGKPSLGGVHRTPRLTNQAPSLFMPRTGIGDRAEACKRSLDGFPGASVNGDQGQEYVRSVTAVCGVGESTRSSARAS